MLQSVILNWSILDDSEHSPLTQYTKNGPAHYLQTLPTIYRPTYQVESDSKGLSSHFKYSLPNKYYDICSHKGCRYGMKGKGSGIYPKPWPRQLLKHQVDHQQDGNEEDPEYQEKMVRWIWNSTTKAISSNLNHIS